MSELYQPTVGGRASICTWELEFYFRTKEQIHKFIDLLMKEEIDYNFEFEKVFDNTTHLYYITVSGSWAHCLMRVAELIKEVDYQNE